VHAPPAAPWKRSDDALVLLNVTATFRSSSSSQTLALLPSGWDRASLCGTEEGGVDDCTLHVRLTQLAPPPSEARCSLAAVLQLACQTQTDSGNLLRQVCITDDRAADAATDGDADGDGDGSTDQLAADRIPGEHVLFPQDSPTISYNETVWGGTQGQRQVYSPATSMLSPAGFATLERLARRNALPNNTQSTDDSTDDDDSGDGSDEEQLSFALSPSMRTFPFTSSQLSLPVRVLLLSTLHSTCLQDMRYYLEVTVEHTRNNCASYSWAPERRFNVSDGGNGTEEVVVPGWSRSTPVPCMDPHASCRIEPADASEPSNGNTTAQCQCDVGFVLSDSAPGTCVDTGVDLSLDANDARPLPSPGDPGHNGTGPVPGPGPGGDPSWAWKQTVNYRLKGNISSALGLQLQPSSTPGAPDSYWYARMNISRAVEDLSLVLHVTVQSMGEDDVQGGGASQSETTVKRSSRPMKLSLSADHYPSLFVHVPLGCPNGSDLVGTSERDWDDDDDDKQFTSFHAPSTADFGGGSCWLLTQPFPDAMSPLSSSKAFKLFLHPAFLKGFLDRVGVPASPTNPEVATTTLFFSLFYDTPAVVDVRAWFQKNLRILVPLCLRPGCARSTDDVREPPPLPLGTTELRPLASPLSSPSSPSPSSSSSSSSSSLSVSDPSPPWVPSNQSWVQTLLENELVYFTLNASTPGMSGSGSSSDPSWWGGQELGSLVVMVNDTRCVGGTATLGWAAPHWWKGSMTSREAELEGVAPTPFPPLPTLPVPGAPAQMALSGACFRANERYSSHPSAVAGIFGALMSICAAAVQLSVWHVPPLALDTRSSSMNVFVPVSLNATGSRCWRDLTLSIPTSVPNDLLITVDQPDAVVLLHEGTLDSTTAPWASYPTHDRQYNATLPSLVPNDEGEGSLAPRVWVQRRIQYTDLSPTQVWHAAVYLDPTPGDGGASHAPRAFRMRLSWATDESGFAHMSMTLKVVFGVGGGVAGLLLLVAAKMRVDKCRADAALQAKARRTQEKARLMQKENKPAEYMRM
jgi:hypothetical protein